ESFSADYLYAATRKRHAGIKQVLMNANIVVGVGNIYANESLFRARVHPRRRARRVTRAECERLVTSIRETLRDALAAGGSSLRDFVHSDGASGYFQQSYYVYDRAGLACRVCGSAIRIARLGSRSSFFCTACLTRGCTNCPTSPPSEAISRTMVAEMNMYCSEGVRNSVSTSGYRLRFI